MLTTKGWWVLSHGPVSQLALGGTLLRAKLQDRGYITVLVLRTMTASKRTNRLKITTCKFVCQANSIFSKFSFKKREREKRGIKINMKNLDSS